MSNSRTTNSIRNIIWAVIQKIMLMLFPFAVRSVMIYKLGAEYTGVGSLFNSILNMLSLAELGFSSAMVYCMYEPIHRQDEDTICALLNLYKKIYGVIGGIILAVGLMLIPFLPNLVDSQIPTGINLYTLYVIYLINSVMSYFLFAYKSSLITAYQRNDVVSIITLVCNVALYVLQIIALLLTANFYLYASLLVVSTVVTNISYEVASRKLFPTITCTGVVEADLKEKIKKRVIGIMLYKISSTTRISFDSIIISSCLGLITLTQYQNYFMIISSVAGILSMVNTAVTASVGDSIVAKNIDDNYRDFRKIVFVYIWIAGCASICILGLIQPFMKLWMGDKLMLSGTMVVMFTVYFYVQAMGDTVFLYRTAAGLWWQDRIRPVVEAIANIILNIILVKILGLFGVILATVITLVVINFLWGADILFRHYFKRSMKGYLVIQCRQAIATVVAGMVTILVCQLIQMDGIIQLLLRLIVCVVVPNIVYFLVNKRNELFGEAKEFVIHIIRVITNKITKQ